MDIVEIAVHTGCSKKGAAALQATLAEVRAEAQDCASKLAVAEGMEFEPEKLSTVGYSAYCAALADNEGIFTSRVCGAAMLVTGSFAVYVGALDLLKDGFSLSGLFPVAYGLVQLPLSAYIFNFLGMGLVARSHRSEVREFGAAAVYPGDKAMIVTGYDYCEGRVTGRTVYYDSIGKVELVPDEQGRTQLKISARSGCPIVSMGQPNGMKHVFPEDLVADVVRRRDEALSHVARTA